MAAAAARTLRCGSESELVAWRIKTVTERTGVPPETLRSWERRYGLVTPARSESGYRQYSDADIATITHLKGLVDSGLAVSEAVDRCRAETQADPPLPSGSDSLREARRRLLQALLDGDEARAVEQLARLGGLPWQGMLSDVILPVDREASWLAAQGQAAPGEVAFLRSWLRDRVAAMRVGLGPGSPEAPPALALRQDGGSEVAQQALAVGLRLGGWRPILLGEPLPLVDAAPILARHAPGLVLLCVDPATSGAQHRTDLGRLEALAPGAVLLVHGATTPQPGGSARTVFDLSELPRP